jgi:hypothetical protein
MKPDTHYLDFYLPNGAENRLLEGIQLLENCVHGVRTKARGPAAQLQALDFSLFCGQLLK